MEYIAITKDLYLSHHGVKGMKWGVRRYQNDDGSLTPAGEARYRMREAGSDYRKASRSLTAKYTTVDKKAAKYEVARDNFKDAKIREKLNNQKKKSKRQEKLEQQYLEKGYTKDEAAIKAYKRARTEKFIIGAAATAAVAAAAYGGYKIYKDRADKFIDKGASFARVTKDSDYNLHEMFYAADKKGDIKKYEGLYGQQIRGWMGNDVFKKNIEATSSIKIASDKHAADTLFDVIGKDTQARKDLGDVLSEYKNAGFDGKQGQIISKAYRDFSKGKNSRAVYEAYNLAINDRDNGGASDRLRNKFTSALKSKGYDALGDVNDRKFSGYGSKNPVIFIDNSKMKVASVSKIDNKYIDDVAEKVRNKLLLKESAKLMAPKLAAGAVAGAVAGAGITAAQNKRIEQYRKEHPDTKLSYNELKAKVKRNEL